MDDSHWLAAKGERDGFLMFLRVRKLPSTEALESDYPHLLAVTWPFQQTDATGLPSTEQYERLSDYESRVFDPLESSGAGLLTVVCTTRGTVEYFAYVRDVDLALGQLKAGEAVLSGLEVAVGEDDRWAQYRTVTSALR